MVRRFISLAVFLFLLFPSVSWATNYYVSTTGSDSDAGTIGAPFLTIQKGVDSAVTAGDQVLVNDGTYAAGFSAATYSGSAESTKVITAITRANPAVVTVASHGYSNGDLVAISELYDYATNGMIQLNDIWFTVANVTTDTFELSGINSTSFDTYVTGGTVRRISPIVIKAVNRGSVTIDKSQTITGWSNSGLPANTYASSASPISNLGLWKVGRNTVLSLQNTVGAVDAENEYFLNESTNVFTIYTTSNPTLSVYKQAGSSAVNVRGVSWVLVDGITAQYSTDSLGIGYGQSGPATATTNIMFRYCTVRYSYIRGAVFSTGSIHKTSHATMDHMLIEYVGHTSAGQTGSNGENGHCVKYAAISNSDDGRYSTVSNSIIHGCHWYGVQSSNAWSHTFIFGNRVYNTGTRNTSGSAAAGIRCGYSGSAEPSSCHVFDNNIGGGVDGTGSGIGSGIFLQDACESAQIFRNNIHDFNWHGIYLFGGSGPKDTLIFNNLIWNNGTTGIRTDKNREYLRIYNNSFYHNGEASLAGIGTSLSLVPTATTNVQFKNNIVQTVTAPSLVTTNTFAVASDYNILYRSDGFKVRWNNTYYTDLASYSAASAFNWDSHSYTTDPLYASPSVGDFQIPSPTTPADSTGTNLVSIVPYDYVLDARNIPFDMGAYNTLGNLIIQPSVTLSSVFPGRVGTVTISFRTTALSVLNNWKFVFTFPAGFTLSSGGSTGATSLVAIDGTVTVSIVGQVVTVTRNGDGTTISPTTMSFTLTNIMNPVASGTTGQYMIRIDDETNTNQGTANSIHGTDISSISPGTLQGLTIGAATLRP